MSAFDRRLLWIGIASALVLALAARAIRYIPHPGTGRSAVMADAKTAQRTHEDELPTVIIIARRRTPQHDR